MKKIAKVLLPLLIAVLLSACSAPADKAPALSLSENVEKALNGHEGLVACDLTDLADLTGLDETMIQECVYLTSSDGLATEEVIALRCTDKKHTEHVKNVLNLYLEQRMQETQNYLPDVYTLLKNTKVQEKGSTVLLVIGQQANTWQNAILAGE